MLSAFISILRLIWPFIRELLFKNKGVKHSIEKNKATSTLVFLYLAMFVINLYLVDHAINNHRYYTDLLGKAAVNLERMESLKELLAMSRRQNQQQQARVDRLESEARIKDKAIQEFSYLVGPEKARVILAHRPEESARPIPNAGSLGSRLKDLGQKYSDER